MWGKERKAQKSAEHSSPSSSTAMQLFYWSSRTHTLRLHQQCMASQHKQALEKCLRKDVAALRDMLQNCYAACSKKLAAQACCPHRDAGGSSGRAQHCHTAQCMGAQPDCPLPCNTASNGCSHGEQNKVFQKPSASFSAFCNMRTMLWPNCGTTCGELCFPNIMPCQVRALGTTGAAWHPSNQFLWAHFPESMNSLTIISIHYFIIVL